MSLDVKVNLFVLGGPKCGTTALCKWLNENKKIYVPEVKELHYFNDDGYRSCFSLEEYESHYEAGVDNKYLVDGSTHYLCSATAVKNILNYNDQAKFIVCLRNPVDMAQSLHSERVWQGMENINSFRDAWGRRKERSKTNVPRVMRGHEEMLNYEWVCSLGAQVERLYRLVPKSDVFLVFFEDLKQNPEALYLKIMDFLSLPIVDADRIDFGVVNSRKQVRSIHISLFIRFASRLKKRLGVRFSFRVLGLMQAANTKKANGGGGGDDLMDELEAAFRDDVKKLKEITGVDLDVWARNR